MKPFTYLRATDVDDAVRQIAALGGSRFIAGGTNLVDLMKANVEGPDRLIDITRLPIRRIVEGADGGLIIGALATNSEVAYNAEVARRYPLLSSAILAGASQQLRNAASVGGNLMQRTRCPYFYDVATPCNKREPGTGCSAIGGYNRTHAILGASEHCIAINPSDMGVALAALDARVHVVGPGGERTIPFTEFHRLPGDTPHIDTNLAPDELIVAVELPAADYSRHYSYLKLRDRLSYAFALVSVAAALRLDDGLIREARLALGGLAHKPWRDRTVELMLAGHRPDRPLFEGAAAALLEGARGFGDNDFKIELARRAIVRALTQAADATPQSQSDKRIA
jgi:xanthine dehydrogenase YagS FAD-binding subunit